MPAISVVLLILATLGTPPAARGPRLESTLGAYQGNADQQVLSCTEGEVFSILKDDHPEWLWVQRQSNHQQGYLPRNYFMLD